METGYRMFDLEQPLQPGDSATLSFETAVEPRGFRARGTPTSLVRNGSYFDRRLLPFVGYQPWFELSPSAQRKMFGLAPRPEMPASNDVEARQHDEVIKNEDAVQVEAIVGTSADQTALFTGAFRRSWEENGRRYFHYGTDRPDAFGASVFSAKYRVVEDGWSSATGESVDLQILHHPEHGYNIGRMMAGMKAALDYYTRAFGPYQYQQLRVVEIPPYSINGRAMITTIAFAEQNFTTHAAPGQVDHTFFGTAHEVAHSWWGGQLRGAYARGRALLSEAISNYSAMMVTEKVLGPDQARRVYDFQLDRYLSRRSAFASDVPLIEVEDHPHISYGKGAVALYTMRELIGDDAVNGALRRLLEKHRSGPPFATSRDLVAELRASTPDSLQYLITDLFETVTLWDVRTERAVVERTPAGAYEVTLDVVARKLRADSVGKETETPMNDLVEIGVFAPSDGDKPADQLYLTRHRMRSGKQTIRLTVAREPARAGVDPYRKLIDRDRSDNVVAVETGVR
jgi:ABC-2 type transport system permease protein